MAKKNSVPSLALFAMGTLLLSLGWLMKSFPLLAFIGFAPFIAIAANNRKEKSIWSSLELVLLGLSISFFAGTFFTLTQLTYVIVHAISFTIPFIGFTFVRKNLGPGVSIITLLLFWLSLEYVFLKLSPFSVIFLADILALKQEWIRWNHWTGYLGSSLWILISNTLFYQAVLTEKKINWLFVILFVLSIAAPLAFSYTVQMEPINKDQMTQLYASNSKGLPVSYGLNGEFIPRTSTWISVLILLYTFVRRKTIKK